MRIEFQIGCELGCVDIAKGILENMDASSQLVVSLSMSVARDNMNDFSHRLEAWLKIESGYGARVSNVHDCSTLRQFDVDYRGRKSVVSVVDRIYSSGQDNDNGFDIVHFYGCEIFFDGCNGFSPDEFMLFCAGAKKAVAYFSEPYVATLPCVEMLQGVMKKCDVSFVYHPRTWMVADGETDGDFGLCGKCSHRVFVDRPVELCSEVHLKMVGEDEASRKGIGEDVRCTTCARRYRAGNGWRLAVNKRCPHYAEHFVSKANSVE